MKSMKLKINIEDGTVDICDLNLQKVQTFENEGGHSCILLNKKQKETCWISQFKENWIKEQDRKEKLKKLHRQFAHCGIEKLFKTIKNANEKRVNKEDFWNNVRKDLEQIVRECKVCKRYKKNSTKTSGRFAISK